jgi:mannose-6-phosphate isomerase
VKPTPVRLAPIYVPRIWGARSLAPLFDSPTGATAIGSEVPIGEVWLTGERCTLASGPFAGKSLGEVWPALPPEWTGTRLQGLPRIPLLVKFIFPADKLSLQVHPDDEYARAHEPAGETGKTEMWYAVTAHEGAEVRLGFAPGVTPESFDRAIDAGTADDCLQRIAVRAGDAFFVPAGTVHTIGPDMVLCEVQQHSDLTYRIFDYDRVQADGTRRPLHRRQARDVMRFDSQRAGKVEPVRTRQGPLAETFLAACRYFSSELWEFSAGVATQTEPGQFELLIVLAGRGRIEWGDESADYERAQVWLLPAALGGYRLAPESETKLLRAYVPDLDAFARRMAARQIAPSAWSGVVHP